MLSSTLLALFAQAGTVTTAMSGGATGLGSGTLASEPGVAAMLGGLGPAGGVVLVVIYFLRYSSRREARWQRTSENLVDRMEKITDRVEAMGSTNRAAIEKVATDFSATVKELNTEYRRTVDSLVNVHKSTGDTINAVSNRVGELTTQVSKLGEVSSGLAREVERLTDEAQRRRA